MNDAMIDRLNTALEGRYRIDRKLGEGGMATVFLADDLRHDRKVALKVLKPELAAVVGAERFLAEIKTTANLQHPHILPLFDSGEADSFLFYVMPYVEGESLREKLNREKQLSVDEAVDIARKVADALDYAHEHDVVHRDVKPANILLSDRGEPLVADFGIALALSAAGGDRITETGLSLGTPHYMSPEQASGDRNVDHRSDLYSLACVLYEMLVGDPPHAGATLQSVLAKVLSEDPRPVTLIRKTVPPNVEAAALKALARVPADRFASVGEFVEALADPDFRLEAGKPRERSGRTPWVARGLAGALVVMAGVAIWAVASRPELPVVRVALGLPADQRPVYGGINLTPPRVALMPDGSAILYVGPGPAAAAEVLPGGGRSFPGGQFALGVASQLWIQPLSELEPRPLAGTEGAWAPAVSPDGRSVAFSVLEENRTQIKVAPITGGPPVTVATTGDLASASWGTSDEVYFVDPSGRRILRVPASGGAVDTVTTLPAFGAGARVLWLDVLPGGDGAIATIGLQAQGRLSTHEVHAIDFGAGSSERLATGVYGIYTSWGYLLYVTSDFVLMAVPFDPGRREITGRPTALIEGVDYRNNGASDVAVSENGSLVYSTTGINAPEMLMWVDREGRVSPVDPAWTGPLEFEAIALSPDGGRVAVEMVERLARGDVWIKQLPRGPLSRLTFEGEDNRVPSWSPDGERIVYLSMNPDGSWQLLQRLADGSGGPEPLPTPEQELHEVVWAPDGSWLLGSVSSEGSDDVVALEVGTDTVWTVLVGGPANQFEPTVSPGGRWLAYVSEESGRAEIYVRPFPATERGKWQISAEGGIEPVWGQSDRELFYRSFDGTVVWRASLDNGPAEATREVVLEIPEGAYEANPRNRLMALTPDGQRFLMINQTGQGDVSGDLVFVQNMRAELERKMVN